MPLPQSHPASLTISPPTPTQIALFNRVRPPLSQALMQTVVQDALNNTFLEYVAKNPEKVARDFHVVLFAHSLGSVICYDLLAQQGPVPPAQTPPNTPASTHTAAPVAPTVPGWAPSTPTSGPSSDPTRATWDKPSKLLFPVLALYALGSPLPLFLAGRGVTTGTLPGAYPRGARGSKHLYNIMHANDPIAYRYRPGRPLLTPAVPSPTATGILEADLAWTGHLCPSFAFAVASKPSGTKHDFIATAI